MNMKKDVGEKILNHNSAVGIKKQVFKHSLVKINARNRVRIASVLSMLT
jgi:hypothetical protein